MLENDNTPVVEENNGVNPEDLFTGLLDDLGEESNQTEEVQQPQAEEVQQEEVSETPTEQSQETEKVENDPTEVNAEALINKINEEAKYLGNQLENKVTDYDDLLARVQKSENHDRMREERDEAKQQAVYSDKLSELAKLWGHESETFLDAMLDQYFVKKAEADNTTPEFVKQQYELDQREKKINRMEESKNKDQKAETERQKMFDDFYNEYPNIKESDIPDEVVKAVDGGENLILDYMRYENQQLKNSNKAYEQKLKNLGAAPIRSTVEHGSKKEDKKDPFLAGFESAF